MQKQELNAADCRHWWNNKFHWWTGFHCIVPKVCLISPGTDLPGDWGLLALGSFPGLLSQTLQGFRILVTFTDLTKVQLLEVAAISQRVKNLPSAISQQLLAIGLNESFKWKKNCIFSSRGIFRDYLQVSSQKYSEQLHTCRANRTFGGNPVPKYPSNMYCS